MESSSSSATAEPGDFRQKSFTSWPLICLQEAMIELDGGHGVKTFSPMLSPLLPPPNSRGPLLKPHLMVAQEINE